MQASLFLASPCTSRSLDPLYLASPAAAHEALLCVRELYQQQNGGHKAMPQGAPAGFGSQFNTFPGRGHLQPQIITGSNKASVSPANGGPQGGAVAGQVGQASQQQQQQRVLMPPPFPPQQGLGGVVGVGEVEDDMQGMHQSGGVGVAPEPPAPHAQHVGPAGMCAQQQGSHGSSKSASVAPSVRGSTDSQGVGGFPAGGRSHPGAGRGGPGSVSATISAQDQHPGSAQSTGALDGDALSEAAEERRRSGQQAGPAAGSGMSR
eukprot:1158801-Pelagomonas_calceolata.AAC.9